MVYSQTIEWNVIVGMTFYFDHPRCSSFVLNVFIAVILQACATAINYKVNPKQMCKSPELVSSNSHFL